MNNKLKNAGLAVLIASLTGCATYNTVPYMGQQVEKIHSVGLVSVDTPPGFTVSVRAPVANSFGLIGGLIEAGVTSNKSNEFTKAIKSLHYSLKTQITQALRSDLTAEGYKVNLVKVSRTPDNFLNYYPKADGNNAFLDVVVHKGRAGYRAAGDSTKYYPYLFVTARLVSSSTHKVLYSQQIVYNPIKPPSTARTISPDQSYGYKDFDHLMADPKQSLEGLKDAVNQVAKAISEDLK